MGKKRIIKDGGASTSEGLESHSSRLPKKKYGRGVLFIEATYNNTKLSLSDPDGNVLAWSSSGSLGFKGAKKGTPFAAGKVGELLAEKAQLVGMKDVDIVVRGVGSGRESSLRAFAGKGIGVNSIKDRTPIPHNGPRPKKPRRV